MSVPIDTWGTIHEGPKALWVVIVESGQRGGFDILMFPPRPSEDIFNYWAGDEGELELFFSEEQPEHEPPPYVWPGELVGVDWNDVGLEADDPRHPENGVAAEQSTETTLAKTMEKFRTIWRRPQK